MTGLLMDKRGRARRGGGFTLIELMIVITIIFILIGIAAARYDQSVTRAKEATLKTDLTVMRQAIDNYTLDKEAAPQSLEHECMGRRGLEVRPLPALLSPGFDHLERAVLSSASLDAHYAPLRCDSLPMPGVPLQFRQFSSLQGKAQLERRRNSVRHRRNLWRQAIGSAGLRKLQVRKNR